jgi:hypothetical protein
MRKANIALIAAAALAAFIFAAWDADASSPNLEGHPDRAGVLQGQAGEAIGVVES